MEAAENAAAVRHVAVRSLPAMLGQELQYILPYTVPQILMWLLATLKLPMEVLELCSLMKRALGLQSAVQGSPWSGCGGHWVWQPQSKQGSVSPHGRGHGARVELPLPLTYNQAYEADPVP